jgi:hypothetical protein
VDLDELEDGLRSLAAKDGFAHGDADSVVRLQRMRSLMDVIATKAAGEFDASGAWAPSGAKSAVAWIGTECRLAPVEARIQVRRGRQLRHLPHAEQAWSEGAVSGAHVDLLAKLRRPATEEVFERDEEMLVAEAKRHTYRHFARICAYWELHADPDGAEAGEMEREARRRVSLSQSIGGMFFGQMNLDPISGTIVYDELARLEAELYLADWAKAKETLGRDPLPHQLERTSPQRWADAMVEMATRSNTAPANGRRPAPLYSVLVSWEALHGPISELERGHTVLSPRTLLAHIEGADLERAVFTPGGRVEVGVTSRLFTGATRRAIEVRDQECMHPYCDEEATRCQADHILEWSKGGLTTQENGRLLCPFHNRQRNQRPPPEE